MEESEHARPQDYYTQLIDRADRRIFREIRNMYLSTACMWVFGIGFLALVGMLVSFQQADPSVLSSWIGWAGGAGAVVCLLAFLIGVGVYRAARSERRRLVEYAQKMEVRKDEQRP